MRILRSSVSLSLSDAKHCWFTNMPSVQTFRKSRCNLPPVLEYLDPEQALRPTLSELSAYYRTHVQTLPAKSRRLVCDFSDNNLNLQHLEVVVAWLQQPGQIVTIYALDLSFNRIQAASWDTFLPLVKQLGVHVQHVDFGGNYLPPLLESEQSLKSLPNNVSLAVTYHSNCGDPWMDSWTRRSRQFKELAYGPTHMNWYERYA